MSSPPSCLERTLLVSCACMRMCVYVYVYYLAYALLELRLLSAALYLASSAAWICQLPSVSNPTLLVVQLSTQQFGTPWMVVLPQLSTMLLVPKLLPCCIRVQHQHNNSAMSNSVFE